MLEQIKALEVQGRWSEIRQLGPALLQFIPASDLARLYESLSRAFALTATGADDWHLALHHAHACLEVATTPMHRLWALHQVTCLAVDMGRTAEVKKFAKAFLKEVKAFTPAERFTPWVLRALSHVHYQRRKFMQAAALRWQVLAMFEETGNDDEIARTKLNLVWAYARAERPGPARKVLMSLNAPESMLHLVHGAEAAVLLAEKQYAKAYELGRLALHGDRLAHDFVDAAEVCLIVAQAARITGAPTVALAYLYIAATFAAQQARSLKVLIALHSGPGGGDFPNVHAAASLGSGGYHPGSGRFLSGIA